MPYIITTRTLDETSGLPGPPMDRPRAVATLDQSRAYASEQVVQASYRADNFDAKAWGDLEMAAIDLPESGGTVGPLPDGTVIEVRRIPIHDLATAQGMAVHAGDWRGSTTDRQIIDGYNAAQERN